MPDKMMPGPVQDAACIREAVCIHTKKIYDSCKEEDIASSIIYYTIKNPSGNPEGFLTLFVSSGDAVPRLIHLGLQSLYHFG